MSEGRINLEQPRWDQGTYLGRAQHFFSTTNPLNLLVSGSELDSAKDLVVKYRRGEEPSGVTEDQLWRAKQLYDSAFHPDTGEKMMLIGRMSAQVPMNMTITGCMMTFYKTTPAVVFWQWINQSFNAIVNYTNRSGDSPITVKQLGTSYVLATGGALVTALGLNSLVKASLLQLISTAPALIGRFVPFAAVAAANLIPPIIMNSLERRGTLRRMPWMGAPLQVLLCGFCLTFATPMCCALFPQRASINVSDLEPELRDKILAMPNAPSVVYYNKGL
ncbi:hypothetical protein B566_EDAN017324 [Ephemera danica]|nr:hypothetical protein B566_EDAN017324 [Ephemera danica]